MKISIKSMQYQHKLVCLIPKNNKQISDKNNMTLYLYILNYKLKVKKIEMN